MNTTPKRPITVARMLNPIRLTTTCYFGCGYAEVGPIEQILDNMEDHYQREHAEQHAKAMNRLALAVGQ
jgi:hypothetical protein